MRSCKPCDRLDLYRQSLVVAWGYADYNDWPVKLNSVFHLFLTEVGEELIADMDYLEVQRGYQAPDIAMLFKNPARVYRMIDSAVYSMRRRGVSLEEQRAVVLRLLDVVAALKHGSEFNENGRNIIYSPSRVVELRRRQLSSVSCTREEALTVHRLCGSLWAYTECIFFRAHSRSI
jgi:hypothetical protein